MRNSKLFCLFFAGISSLLAQQTVYSPDDILYRKHFTTVDFTIRSTEPEVFYSVYREIEYPSDKKLGINTQSVFYSDFYSYNRKGEANVYYPKKKAGTFKKRAVRNSYKNTVTGEGIFYEDLTRETFVFGEIKAGGKTSLDYSYLIKDPVLVPKILFNHELFAVELNVKIIIPDNMKVKMVFAGDSSGIIHTSVKTEGAVVHTYSASARPALEKEEDGPSIWHYSPHLILIPVSYTSGTKEIPLAGTVESLFKRYNKSLAEIPKWDTTQLFRLTDSIAGKFSDTLSRIEGIYKWVQSNIRYIAFEDAKNGFVPRSPEKVLKNRYGDCKDMATLLVNMLGRAGVSAHHTWIGTRKYPYRYSEVPSPHCDDHMIASAKYRNSYIILDATSPVNEIGFPTAFIQGKEALIRLNDTAYDVYRIPVTESGKTVRFDSVYLKIKDKTLAGNGMQRVSGYFKDEYRYYLKNSSEPAATLAHKINIGNDKTEIRNTNLELPSGKQDIKISYEVKMPDYASFFNDEIYVNMNVSKTFNNDFIEKEKRKCAIESEYKYNLVEKIFLEIPEGMFISKKPENSTYTNKAFSFDISYDQTDSHLILNKKIEVNHLLLQTGEFEEWNKMIEKISDSYSQVVILKTKK